MEERDNHIRERKRRRRERIIILITVIVIVLLTYIESHLTHIEELVPVSNEVLIFGLININVILIILLIFLIVRNLVKIIFERRRGILGSKLRTKLVMAFVCLSLVPTVVLFLVAIQFLSYSIDNWFNVKINSALKRSLEVAQTYYQQSADNAQSYAKQISSEITENKLYEKEKIDYLKTLIEQRQKSYNLGSVEVYFDNRKERLFIRDQNNPNIPPIELSAKILEDVFMGKETSTVRSVGTGDLISGLAPIFTNYKPREVIGVVVISYYMGKELVDKMTIISSTNEEYKQLTLMKNPIKFSLIITLSIVTLLIIFSATWFGLFLAKGITGPIHDLAEATDEISRGNLDYHIDVLADDEIGVLVDSFNKMTKDLKVSNEDLKLANMDLEQRRQYMETVLKNVSAGIVSVDRDGVISTINRAAERMLDIKTEKVIGRKYEEVLKPEYMELVNEFLKELNETSSDFIEKQIQLMLRDRILTVLVAVTLSRNDNGNYMGMVVVFEDLTQLQKAERIAAWREVARRIAHEIKNPLTPVKLCAERLQRKYGDKISGTDGTVFQECTRTISNQVEVLKRLVNEFSHFARLPVTNPTPNDLNKVILDSIILFQDAHKDITFDFQKDDRMPEINIDAEQIKRVMVNLLDNAVEAVSGLNSSGMIEIRTSCNRNQRKARVEVCDNGPGISPKNKIKLFEPYFSTKKSGMGLGLAIVDSIISDHNGSVIVGDNIPLGTVIAFELPIT
ncbi:MAG: PAS domain-containing protein [Deltaproteobacteria bacterium]|nr:PAS domain-containing protein [Deltaproteobacteria bacterium]